MENSLSENRIHILPDFIANQIAAGEVVQRPESVVKELVENSMDSGADSIAVVVRGAGKQLIHIVDNGCGMTKDDLLLSVKRHATSKIFSSDDLEEIKTFGFRGEALASIASVANLEIRTKRQSDEHGWSLIAEPMKEPGIEPCYMDSGTQVFVRNLFFNVPARRKFLKTNLTEFRYIADTMLKFAISNPNIRFTFYDEDTLIFDLQKSGLEERIKNALGEKTSNSLMSIYSINDYVEISGFIGQPHLARQTKTGQYLFLNGRSIISKSISHAVFSAFEHLLEKSVNPLYIINIKTDPRKFDVNVHPQKHEVKFEDERFIYSMVNRAVSETLKNNNLAPEARILEQLSQSPFEKTSLSFGTSGNDMVLVNRATGEIIDNTSHKTENYRNQDIPFAKSPEYQRNDFPFRKQEQRFDVSAFDAVFGKNEINNVDVEIKTDEKNKTGFFWQMHNKYIFIQTENGFMVLDQHASHERVLYEKAIKAMNREFAYSQELLFPINVVLTPSAVSTFKEILNELQELGYRFGSISEKEIEVLAVPTDVRNGDEIRSFTEIVDYYAEFQKIKHTDKRDALAASYSCKTAIKTGQPLSVLEMKKLTDDLFNCNNPYSCPHGRPTVIEFSLNEFDKRFGRI